MEQSGKPEVVVVTGASAGLGRAIVRRFAREGASIGLLARGRDGLEGARPDVEELGGKALVLPTDVADADAVERAAHAVEQEFGPIDIWINNAMVSVFSPVKEMKPDEYRRVTEVTYLGYVYGTLAALRRMLPRDRGVVVQVGSALAYRGIPLQSAYCGAKHAIPGFMDSLRAELLHDKSKVRVTMVQMPAMNTPQFGWVKSRLPNKPLPVPPLDVQPGDTVRGSDHGEIGTVERVVAATEEHEAYLLAPRGLIFQTDTYIPLDAVVKRAGKDVFVNIPKLVVGEMPWAEPPSRTERRAKLGPRAAEVDKLYRSKSPSAHARSARGAS